MEWSIRRIGGALSLGVVQSEDWGWADNRTTSLIAGGVLLTVFWFHQRRSERPALDLDLFGIGMLRGRILRCLSMGAPSQRVFWFGAVPHRCVGVVDNCCRIRCRSWSVMVALLAPRAGKLAAVVGRRPLWCRSPAFCGIGPARVVMLGAEPNYLVDYLPSLLTALDVPVMIHCVSTIAQALPRTGWCGLGAQSACPTFEPADCSHRGVPQWRDSQRAKLLPDSTEFGG